MREIVSIHIGQAGVQIGNAIWELLCTEHGINEEGIIKENSREIECLDTFFSLSHSSRYIPRSIFVDLEASVIDEVKHGAYKSLFHPDRLITGPEDAASNFARGFFTVGKLLLGVVSHELKKLLESGDNTQAIIIYRSLGGGTGSGLTSAIFDSLADYPKLVKIEMPVYPSPTLSTAMVEPYNCLLSEHFCMEDIDIGLLFDNEALYDICSKYLSLTHPTYATINRLIAQLVSSITASVRFESVMNCDISVLQTNLVPYPRIHFPLANFAPILSSAKATHEELTIIDLTRAVFEKENQMMKIDHSFGRFMSCSLLYRGEVSPYHVYQALSVVKKDKNIEFVEWCPTGFKVGINVCPPVTIPASEIYQSSRNVAMLANTSAIGQAWQRITHKFYLLYSKRSFVHWFVGEGMEECEFTESLYNISALVKDYEEVTLDRDFEEESGAPLTSEKEGADILPDQSNTAFTDNTKPSEPRTDELGNQSETEERKTMQNEKNYAQEQVIHEEDVDENIDTKEENSREEGNDDEETSEEVNEEDNANDQNNEEKNEVEDITEEKSERKEEENEEKESNEGGNAYEEEKVEEENAEEENVNGEDAEEIEEENDNDNDQNAEETSGEDDNEEDNQNCRIKFNAQTSNNCGETTEQSYDCCTINDNTLDYIKASVAEEELNTKEYYSSIM